MCTSNGWNADGLIDGDLDFSNTRTTHEAITEVWGKQKCRHPLHCHDYRQTTDRIGVHKSASSR